MNARITDLTTRLAARPHPLTHAAAMARKHRRRYQLIVVAPTVDDVARNAGGWLFDRVLGGWDVTAMVGDHENSRPLDILGVRVVDLHEALASRVRTPLPQAIAIDTHLYATDSRVREGILDVFDYVLIDHVTLWGERYPNEIDERVTSVQHQLSGAAQAFKTQALSTITSSADRAEPTEQFRSCRLRPARDGFDDLVPAAG